MILLCTDDARCAPLPPRMPAILAQAAVNPRSCESRQQKAQERRPRLGQEVPRLPYLPYRWNPRERVNWCRAAVRQGYAGRD